MRGAALAVLLMFGVAVQGANPAATGREIDPHLDRVGLRSIAGWLKAHGSDGYLGAGVARALGIARGDAALDARQRGFRNAGALRIAQLLPDGSMLFMVQATNGEVTFYHSTAADGLRRALLSVPQRGLVVPLVREDAQPRFLAAERQH